MLANALSTTSVPSAKSVQGAGLGLRRTFAASSDLTQVPFYFDFLEIAPENWMRIGGKWAKRFAELIELHTFVAHGLSLSLGGPTPFNDSFLQDLKKFFNRSGISLYSEHLSYCTDKGQLYDLMPIPFTEEAVVYVSKSIAHVQNVLEQRIAVENISYYAAPGREISELDFFLAVVQQADCDILLDVNNLYVNSINHVYSPNEFLAALPRERVRYLHVAGHYQQAPDLIIDTHGAAVADPVWDLLQQVYQHFGPLPTVLERDFNIPELPILFDELQQIKRLQQV